MLNRYCNIGKRINKPRPRPNDFKPRNIPYRLCEKDNGDFFK